MDKYRKYFEDETCGALIDTIESFMTEGGLTGIDVLRCAALALLRHEALSTGSTLEEAVESASAKLDEQTMDEEMLAAAAGGNHANVTASHRDTDTDLPEV